MAKPDGSLLAHQTNAWTRATTVSFQQGNRSLSSPRIAMLGKMAERLDGKYEVVRELERSPELRQLEALDANGKSVRVDWYMVSDPKSRSSFHRYRTAVKNAASPLLLDAVARPGAYYTVWETVDGVDAVTWLEGHPKDESFRRGLSELGDVLESYGFALQDAQVIALQSDKEVRPALVSLRSADRSSPDIKALNTALLQPVKAGRGRSVASKPARVVGSEPTKAPVAQGAKASGPSLRRRLTVWGIIPGVALLAVFGWLGAQAVATFLEPPTVEVPNVKGKNLQDTLKILADARLNPRVSEGSDQTQLKGIVLAQNPIAGTTLTEQRIVEITVNRPRPLLMPDLAGKTVSEAKLALTEAKLLIGRTAVIPAPAGMAPSMIVGQSPPAQTEVVKGQGITLLVSGSRAAAGKTFIPDLSGLSFDDAKLIVTAAGLRLVEVRTKASNLPSGVVISQSPKAYSTVALESEATITVAIASTARKPIIPRPVQPASPPPPPVAPPVAPPPPVVPPVIDPNSGVTPSGPGGLPPMTNPENPSPAPTPPPVTPENPPPMIEGKRQCPVTFAYTIPADLGTVSLEVRVIDDDGERVVLPATPLPGGTPWEQKDYPVRGKATFTVFVDGVSKAVEERDPRC